MKTLITQILKMPLSMQSFNGKAVSTMVTKTFIASLLFTTASYAQTNTDFSALPAGSALPNKPNVIINLSVETPMQGAAYNDQFDAGELDSALQCTGDFARANYGQFNGQLSGDDDGRAVGRCFHPSKKYIGYFNPDKCYDYSVARNRFEASGPVNNASLHTCSGNFSGNFMNWATMTSIDAFRYAMTGGMRRVDDADETVLERAFINKSVDSYQQWFPVKGIFSSINIAPNQVTPFGGDRLFITKYSNFDDRDDIQNLRIKFGRVPDHEESNPLMANVTVRVLVCDDPSALEESCKAYKDSSGNTIYKPIGLLQEFSDRLRFSLFSYLNDDAIARQGGVMRARMKDIGPIGRDIDGRAIDNLNQEWDEETGIFIQNPDSDDASSFGGVSDSGVINYLNKFGARNGYKGRDPVSEMFYECLRYYRNMPPTRDAVRDLNDSRRDGFPVIVWNPDNDDPIQKPCQRNYIVGLNDVYAHRDKRIPGTSVTVDGTDEGDAGSPDPSDTFNVTNWTNQVGNHEFTAANDLENFKIRNVQEVVNGRLSFKNLGSLNASTLDLGATITSGRRNSFYAAGLAYWANTQNIRPDLPDTDNQPVTVKTFFVDSQEYQSNPILGPENVLYLAAKYGGFTDVNDNGVPDLDREWNLNGNSLTLPQAPNTGTSYKLPDNYAVASNPDAMIEGLRNAFTRIAAAEERSGTAPANLSNSEGNGGLLVQALYFQETTDRDTGEQVAWTGQVHAFFIDEFGLFRDDSGSVKNQLDANDKVFTYFLEDNENGVAQLKIQRFNPRDNSDNDDSQLVEFGQPITLDELVTIWSAQDILSTYDNDNIINQRTYSNVASSTGASRHILTVVDPDTNGVGQQIDFAESAINAPNMAMLAPKGADETIKLANARKLVNFIRGYDDSSLDLRNRRVGSDTPGEKVLRLGDVVNSTPEIVASPNQSYDTELGDAAYAEFIEQYRDRREVIYAGANDGLLHAFNVGFRDQTPGANVAFNATDPSSKGRSAHELGAELWAYAPHNLLPHLQWLAEKNYAHVFYVDGQIQAFDAKIFDNDADHPGGWGTILVAGMRLGGGDFSLDTDNDGTNDYTTRSGYVIIDVTNPEKPPKILAEVTDPDLNFTTSRPTLDKDIPNDQWTLVFGSGPNNRNFSTDESAKLFTYDISDLGKNSDPILVTDITSSNQIDIPNSDKSFVGNLSVRDWNRDFTDDVVYFGTIGTETVTTGADSSEQETGKLYRYLPRNVNGTNSGINLLFNADRPIQGAPLASFAGGKPWVFFGTGRFFSEVDAITPAAEYQERYYGLLEPDAGNDRVYEYGSSVPNTDLLNVTNIAVSFDDPDTPENEGGDLTDSSNVISDPEVDTETELSNYILETKDGWYRELPTNGAAPSDRIFTNPSSFRNLLFFTSFEPNDNLCESSEGTSDIFGLNMVTGTATGFGILGGPDDNGNSTVSRSLGDGRASEVVLFAGQGLGNDKGRGIIQQDNGKLTNLPITLGPATTPSILRRAWREIAF